LIIQQKKNIGTDLSQLVILIFEYIFYLFDVISYIYILSLIRFCFKTLKITTEIIFISIALIFISYYPYKLLSLGLQPESSIYIGSPSLQKSNIHKKTHNSWWNIYPWRYMAAIRHFSTIRLSISIMLDDISLWLGGLWCCMCLHIIDFLCKKW